MMPWLQKLLKSGSISWCSHEKICLLANENCHKTDSIWAKGGDIRWLRVKRLKPVEEGREMKWHVKREGCYWKTDEKQRQTRGKGSGYHCQPVKELGLPAGARLQAEWRPSMPGLRVCLAQFPGARPGRPLPRSWLWCVYRTLVSC